MIEGPFVMQRERIACPQAPTHRTLRGWGRQSKKFRAASHRDNSFRTFKAPTGGWRLTDALFRVVPAKALHQQYPGHPRKVNCVEEAVKDPGTPPNLVQLKELFRLATKAQISRYTGGASCIKLVLVERACVKCLNASQSAKKMETERTPRGRQKQLQLSDNHQPMIRRSADNDIVDRNITAKIVQQGKRLCRKNATTPVADLLGLINTTSSIEPTDTDITISAASTSTDSDDEWATLPEPEFPGDSDEDQGDAEDEMDNENLFAESPTLTRLDEGDVELDMDEVPEWDLDEDDEEVSDSDSDLDSDEGEDV
ncbi:hypothetical protein B0H14DRAFT_2626184 [Mycena olivaceomarginata]|nr:hypothetical protein B0H14DRAFT_2626184 [Mycena olivaceomarginata]